MLSERFGVISWLSQFSEIVGLKQKSQERTPVCRNTPIQPCSPLFCWSVVVRKEADPRRSSSRFVNNLAVLGTLLPLPLSIFLLLLSLCIACSFLCLRFLLECRPARACCHSLYKVATAAVPLQRGLLTRERPGSAWHVPSLSVRAFLLQPDWVPCEGRAQPVRLTTVCPVPRTVAGHLLN